MYAPFISLETGGWKSVPEEKRREIVNFLRATREKRKELNVEFPVLDFNWRRYTKEGQDLIRREEYRRKKSETAKGSAHS
jgi:hypothetical protein